MTTLNQAPLFRLFRLMADKNHLDEFAQVGHHNLTTSIKTEPGTLAMYIAQDSSDPSINYVVEVYRDEASYQTHVASEQFLAFASFAKDGLTDRVVYHLTPQLLLEKKAPLFSEKASSLSIRLAEVTVNPDDMAAFKAIVIQEMKDAMAKEAGVLVMYAGTLANQANVWRFVEIYQDEAAYESHCETEHFKTYIAETAGMVADKQLHLLKASVLVNQGELEYEN